MARTRGTNRDVVRDTVLGSCFSCAVAFFVGVVSRLAGLDDRLAATGLIAVALGGGACVAYRAVATRVRGYRGVVVAAVIAVAAGSPAIPTLWPGTPILTGRLANPGEEIRASSPLRGAGWVLVATDVDHERTPWWRGEYELRVGDATAVGALGRVRVQEWRGDRLRFRRPTKTPARYHRNLLGDTWSAVRLERLTGNVPGGLKVSVYRAPIRPWLAFVVLAVGLAAALVVDVKCVLKGSLGMAAAIPMTISLMVWRYVTPAEPLESAFHAMMAGAFIGSLLGLGAARAAWLALRLTRDA